MLAKFVFSMRDYLFFVIGVVFSVTMSPKKNKVVVDEEWEFSIRTLVASNDIKTKQHRQQYSTRFFGIMRVQRLRMLIPTFMGITAHLIWKHETISNSNFRTDSKKCSDQDRGDFLNKPTSQGIQILKISYDTLQIDLLKS